MMKSLYALLIIFGSTERMLQTRIIYEQQVLDEIREIPVSEFPKLLKLLHLLKEEFFRPFQPSTKTEREAGTQNQAEQQDIARALTAVENTWGSIPLDKETAKYVAEDKELEYDI